MTDFDSGTDFINGQEANANEVNARFTAIETFLNTTGVHVYQAATIETAALEDSAVTTAKIADSNITTAKIADDNVTAAKIADGAIDATAKIGTGVVTSTNILDATIATGDLADGAVTAAKVAADVATQAELDAHVNDTSAAHAASAISVNSATLVGVGTDVQAVFEEIDNAIVAAESATAAHLADTTAAHAASAISYAGGTGISATDVEAALDEINGDVIADVAALAAHIADTSDAHDASAISILDSANDFAATDVEGALAELQAADEADEAALAAHIADTSDAHDASAISVLDTAANFTATDVEGVLAEMQQSLEDVSAGGIADGSVTSAKIANNAIMNEDVNSAAAIAFSKLASLTTGNVLYGVANVATSGTPDAAGLVDKTTAQTISGAKTFSDTLTLQSAAANNHVIMWTEAAANKWQLAYEGSGANELQIYDYDGARNVLRLVPNGIINFEGATASGRALTIGTDFGMYRSAAAIASVISGAKIQQSTAPSVADDLVNKSYADRKLGRTVTAMKTGAYDAAVGELVKCNGTFTVSLPASHESGDTIVIMPVGGGTITVDPADADTINGSSSATVTFGSSGTFVSDGTNWLSI